VVAAFEARPRVEAMTITPHIRATGISRVAAVAAIVATSIGLILCGAPSTADAMPPIDYTSPAGGCGTAC
jgi:hypothetical protein